MSLITDLRDSVYLQILTKQTASEYAYGNSFSLERTWRPWDRLETLSRDHPTGKVYVIGGNPVGYVNQSRTQTVLAEYAVMLGFQRYVTDLDDVDEIDSYTGFLEELEDTCRLEVVPDQFSFTRLEYLRDPDGMPLAFVRLRDAATFEAYFTVYYNRVRAH
jgi:hypothetical protein